MTRLGVLALCGALAACAGQRGADPGPRSFDFGADAPRAQLPALRGVAVRAAVPFDGVEMHYRLAWREPAELASFARNRWAAPPAELVRRQLLRALPPSSAAPCALDIELHEFSQVFSARETSEARLELRAVLSAAGGQVAARGMRVAEPGAGANAAAGAGAFARAAERAIAELGGWIAAQPACRP